MHALYSFLAGLLFGIGLIISEMMNPQKVLGFLDLAGSWDPSLGLVMAGAIGVGAIAFAIARTREKTLLGAPMQLPRIRGIDGGLALGSVAFGVGWGLAGFDPGPALVALGTGHVKAFIFVVALIGGMGIYEFAERRRAQKAAREPSHTHSHAHEHSRAKHRPHKGHH
jgi:uncharacterized membrane protein YedE/YeeE